MPKTVYQSVAWFKRYKTLKSVTVGSLNLRKFSYSAKTRSAFGLARNKYMDGPTQRKTQAPDAHTMGVADSLNA